MSVQAWRGLYPGLTEAELLIASENIDAYLEIAWEIFEDLPERNGAVDRELNEQ
ncbi:MAG: hypothetical protein WCA10_10075 [Terracidiphilus sp.]